MHYEHELQPQTDAVSKQRHYLSPEGKNCKNLSEANNFCYWHNDASIKSDPDLIDKIQNLASSGASLVGCQLNLNKSVES